MPGSTCKGGSKAHLFVHPLWLHVYGRLPVCILRCLAKLEDCTEVSTGGREASGGKARRTSENRFPHPTWLQA